MNTKLIPILIIVVCTLLIAGVGYWYWQEKSTSQVQETDTEMLVDQKIADISLGNQILQRTQILLEDRFPETNPLKQIIKNPF